MFNYRLLIEYHQKGNNHTQIALLCSCSRHTVIKVLNEINELEIELPLSKEITNKELARILFPKKNASEDGYLLVDFAWEQFQMVKHQSSLRLCWRRYYKRAQKQNLKAYVWSRYNELYHEYLEPPKADDKDKIRKKLQDYNFLLKLFRNKEGMGYIQMKADKEEWLKSLHLDEDKILDETNKFKE